MKAKWISTMIAAPLLALSTMAFAGEPVQLNAAQMDHVTAGGISYANALAGAIGPSFAATVTFASALTNVVVSQTFETTTISGVGSAAISTSASSAM